MEVPAATPGMSLQGFAHAPGGGHTSLHTHGGCFGRFYRNLRISPLNQSHLRCTLQLRLCFGAESGQSIVIPRCFKVSPSRLAVGQADGDLCQNVLPVVCWDGEAHCQ